MTSLPGEVKATEKEQELVHIDEGQPQWVQLTGAGVYGYGYISMG